MNDNADRDAVDKLNAGEPISIVDPVYLKNAWEAALNIPVEHRNTIALGLGAVAGGNTALHDLLADARLRVAFMVRFSILQALIDQGALNDYMEDEAKRDDVFRAVASMPFDRMDGAEAPSQRILQDAPPDAVQERKEEMLASGIDPDHPKLIAKLLASMAQNT